MCRQIQSFNNLKVVVFLIKTKREREIERNLYDLSLKSNLLFCDPLFIVEEKVKRTMMIII